MDKFKYKIGQDCWMINPGYGHLLYRCSIFSRISEETAPEVKYTYRVKLEGDLNMVDCKEEYLFDISTRCNDALCFMESLLSKRATESKQ